MNNSNLSPAGNPVNTDPFAWGGVGPDPLSNIYPASDPLSGRQRLYLGGGKDIGELITHNALSESRLAEWTAKGWRVGDRRKSVPYSTVPVASDSIDYGDGESSSIAPYVPDGTSGLWLWADGQLHPFPPPTSCQSYRRGSQVWYSDGRKWSTAQGLVNCAICQQSALEKGRLATVEVYGSDVIIRRKRLAMTAPVSQSPAGKRSDITQFSRRSAGRLLHTARNVEGLTHMITLTYPKEYPTDGLVVKRHWGLMRDWLYRTKKLQGLMVLEFQKRGAPHLHLYTNAPLDKKELSERWYGVVGSGDVKHLKAGTKVEELREKHSIFMYCVKYISKGEQKEVPEGYESVGRFWSLWGGCTVKPEQVLTAPAAVLAPIIRIVRRYDVARRRSVGLRPSHDKGERGYKVWGAGALLLQKVKRSVSAVLPETGELVKTECQTTIQALVASSARLSSWLCLPPMFARSEPCIA